LVIANCQLPDKAPFCDDPPEDEELLPHAESIIVAANNKTHSIVTRHREDRDERAWPSVGLGIESLLDVCMVF
jgi:hypothetical protein